MRITAWLKIAIFNFFIAALMGLSLRAAFVWDFSWMNYKYMLHGHSHIAMLGWVFMALYAMLIAGFVPRIKQNSPYYRRLFFLLQFSVIGMMIAFPLQGYDTISIIFSTLNLILSYFFAFRIWRDAYRNKTSSPLLMRFSLIGLLVSSLGLWGMAVVMAFKLNHTEWYTIVIQFYLHFQFNAWFILAAISLVLNFLAKRKGIALPNKLIRRFSIFYMLSVVLTFSHVLHWAYAHDYYYILNSIGVVVQFITVVYLFFGLHKINIFSFKTFFQNREVLLLVALASWFLKGFIQLFLVDPGILEIATSIRNFMIGYLHLINLGIVSCILFYLLNNIYANSNLKMGVYVFLLGIFGTEIYLFVQAFFYWQLLGNLPHYHTILFILSAFLPLGILLIGRKMYQSKKNFIQL